MSDLIPMTSWSRNKKHLAHAESLRSPGGREKGQCGTALCDSQIHAEVYDQEWLDAKREEWFGKPPGSQLIVNLPPCKRCEKHALKLEGGAS